MNTARCWRSSHARGARCTSTGSLAAGGGGVAHSPQYEHELYVSVAEGSRWLFRNWKRLGPAEQRYIREEAQAHGERVPEDTTDGVPKWEDYDPARDKKRPRWFWRLAS